jgi:hypothetical protein
MGDGTAHKAGTAKTNYTLDEVAEMDWLTFDVMGAVMKAEDDARKAERSKVPEAPKILRGRK